MMKYAVYLKIKHETQTRFDAIHKALNQGVKESQANDLGQVISAIACEVIEQAFTDLIREQSRQGKVSSSVTEESMKVLETVQDAIRKYLPWSVSFFGNDRLKPVVNHLAQYKFEHDDVTYLRYNVDSTLVQEALGCVEQVREQQPHSILRAFKSLIKIIDQGVTILIREPKDMLKFNFVVNKTLNGVINMTTHLGYKRLEKLGSQMDYATANEYVDHFMGFLYDEALPKTTSA